MLKQAIDKMVFWRKKHSGLLFYTLMMIWPVAQFLVFYVYTHIHSFFLAFKTYDFELGGFRWVGLDNFRRLWFEFTELGTLKDQLINSLVTWVIISPIRFLCTLFLAYYVYKKFRGAYFFRVIMFMPSVLPSMIMVMIHKTFMNDAIPAYLAEIGINVGPLATLTSDTRFFAPLALDFLLNVGGTLIVVGNMNQIPQSTIEAAKLDGITPIREFWSIVLPQMSAYLTVILVDMMSGILGATTSMFSFYGYNVFEKDRTLAYQSFTMINRPGNGMTQYGLASALGLCTSAIACVVTFIARRIAEKRGDD